MTSATPRLDLKLVFVLLCLGAITSCLPMPPGMSKADENAGSEVENNSPTSQPSMSGGNSPLPHNNPEEDESAPAGPNDSAAQPGSGDSNPSPPRPATDAPKPIPNEEEGGGGNAGTTTASGSTSKPAENSEESDEDEGESDEDESEESDENVSKEASKEKEQEGGNNSNAEQGEQSDSDESFEYNSLDQLSDESDEDNDDDDDSDTYEDSDSYEDEERRRSGKKEKTLPSLKSKIRQLGGNDIDSDFGDGFPTERDREPGSAGEFDPFGQDTRTSGKPETSTQKSRTEAAEAMMP